MVLEGLMDPESVFPRPASLLAKILFLEKIPSPWGFLVKIPIPLPKLPNVLLPNPEKVKLEKGAFFYYFVYLVSLSLSAYLVNLA
jgi:hypothetical protein